MSFAIHGARGLGKSAFVNVLLARKKFLRRTAQADMQFDRHFSPIVSALNEGLVITALAETTAATMSGGLNVHVLQAGNELSTQHVQTRAPVMPEAIDLDFVANALANPADQIDAVVIEEFQRLPAPTQRDLVQLMHILADRRITVRLIVIGITGLGEQAHAG